MRARLGVNIDHVATLRQARGESYPSVVDAAKLALESGADQITIHLREDRRHIQDADVIAVKKITDNYERPLNLEIGANEEIIQIAIDTSPDWVCIVPEKREEQTTEGGLNIVDQEQFEKIFNTCKRFKKETPNTKISLFVEADEEVLKNALKMDIDAVEIHTGDYAKAFLMGESIDSHLEQFSKSKELFVGSNVGYHAGHGLTDESLKPLVESRLFEEYNIGHWIISDSIFCGLENSIGKLKGIINTKDL